MASRSRGSSSPSRTRRSEAREQEDALAELKLGAMVLLADGLDIGQMKVSDVMDLTAAHLNPLRMISRARSPKLAHRKEQLQRKSATQLKVLAAYQSAMPPLPAIDPLNSSSMTSSISTMRGGRGASRRGRRSGW